MGIVSKIIHLLQHMITYQCLKYPHAVFGCIESSMELNWTFRFRIQDGNKLALKHNSAHLEIEE